MGVEDMTKWKFFELLKFLTRYVNEKAFHTTTVNVSCMCNEDNACV